ncbi:MAG: hypothetical protein LLG04_14210 [Parachlamydia sp.]|nr:hypothetical protein [Parachlamydia sp.]
MASYGDYSSRSSTMEDLYKKWYEDGNNERDALQQKLWKTESELTSQKSEISVLQQQMARLKLDMSQLKSRSDMEKESHQREVKHLKELNKQSENSADDMQRLYSESLSDYNMLSVRYTTLGQKFEKLVANANASKDIFERQKNMLADLQGRLQRATSEGAGKEAELQRKEEENQRLQAEIAFLRKQILEKQVTQETPAAAAPTPDITPAIEAASTTTGDEPGAPEAPSEDPQSPKAPPSLPPAYAYRFVEEEDAPRQAWLEKQAAIARADEQRRRDEEAQRYRDLQLQAAVAQDAEEEEVAPRRSYNRQTSSRQLQYRN